MSHISVHLVTSNADVTCPCAFLLLPPGKQLNAIRACGRSLGAAPCSTGPLRYDPGGQYLSAIQSALARASSGLMQLMMEEVQLMGWLRSIKHYFLLDQVGDSSLSALPYNLEWCGVSACSQLLPIGTDWFKQTAAIVRARPRMPSTELRQGSDFDG